MFPHFQFCRPGVVLIVLNALVSTLWAEPSIEITRVEPHGVYGRVHDVDPATAQVVVWAYTNQYYVQPFTATPFTPIQPDSTWSCFTHGGDRHVALLVTMAFTETGSPRELHPLLSHDVRAWDEFPVPRIIDFSGYRWFVKYGQLFGPGPNDFSDSSANVWVDDEGLHLRIEQRDGRWYCAEVFMLNSLTYGRYRFEIDGRVDSLDPRVILGAFTYQSLTQEIDIEFTRGLDMIAPNNAQYVVQPYDTPGNRMRFVMPPVEESAHRFEWTPTQVTFASWRGFTEEPLPDSLIASWIYDGPDVPDDDIERMRFNLWLDNGQAPTDGQPVEVIIRSFGYAPMPPRELTIAPEGNDMVLRWRDDDALWYHVHAASSDGGIFTEIGVTSDTAFVHAGGATQARRFYRVTASVEP